MRHDELPLNPCRLGTAHEPHRRAIGPMPSWCPGIAPEWPGEKVYSAQEAIDLDGRVRRNVST